MEEYKKYPATAKAWVYQADRILDEDEVNYIRVVVDEFITNWESHGKLLKASFDVFHNLFVVLFVDEDGDTMCGRAQDASVKLMKELEQQLEISLLDRMIQSYRKDGKVVVATMAEFSRLIENKEIDENTIVFNNTITTKAAFDTQWEVPLKDSWHKQLLVVNS
ncbi:MAG: hypothetical protein KDD41_10060 [Flavobacteriales bacterium]|nr:hypothetical protein [Flavobacteriales bacterium]